MWFLIFPMKNVGQRYFFKSRVLPGNERAIVCAYSKNDIFDCAWYDITTNSFYNYIDTEIKYNSFHLVTIFIEYFEETHEILIGKPGIKYLLLNAQKNSNVIHNIVNNYQDLVI